MPTTLSSSYSRIARLPISYLPRSITITSETAVGKTKTVEAMEKLTNWTLVSGGAIMQRFADKRGMTKQAFAKWNRLHPEAGMDKACDGEIMQEGEHDERIFDGRAVHIFVPRAYHVRLVCPIDIRAERRHRDEKEKNFRITVEEVERDICQRDDDDNERLSGLYDDFIWPDADFDLVLSTYTNGNPDNIAEIILTEQAEWAARLG